MSIFLITFIIFLIYTPPLINYSDGAEFVISLKTLGISHPPSYPLFLSVSRILYYIPLGNIYFRLCLFSIIVSSLVVLVIWKYYKVSKLQKIAIILFLLSCESFFENTLLGEVYGLNLFFVTIIFLFLDKCEDKRFFYVLFFLIGLGLGNHHLLILMIPYVFFTFFRKRRLYYLKDYILGTALFIFGFSIYLYLPFRASKEPLWNWGNPQSFSFFLNSFFRLDFPNKGLIRPIDYLILQIKSLNPVEHVGLINALICMLSLILLFLKNKKAFSEYIIPILSHSLLLILLLGYDEIQTDTMIITYGPFYIPLYFFLAITICNAIESFDKKIVYIFISLLFIGLITNLRDYLFSFNFTKFSFKTFNFTRSKMSMLPRNSVLILKGGEEDFPIFFEQKIAKFREDLHLIPLSMLGKKWNFKESIKAGTTYTKGFEGEVDSKKAILKAVILFQKDFNNKRVFVPIKDKEELPDSLKFDINGPFFEYKRIYPVNPDFLREAYLDKKDDLISEIVRLNMLEHKGKTKEKDYFLRYSTLWTMFK